MAFAAKAFLSDGTYRKCMDTEEHHYQVIWGADWSHQFSRKMPHNYSHMVCIAAHAHVEVNQPWTEDLHCIRCNDECARGKCENVLCHEVFLDDSEVLPPRQSFRCSIGISKSERMPYEREIQDHTPPTISIGCPHASDLQHIAHLRDRHPFS